MLIYNMNKLYSILLLSLLTACGGQSIPEPECEDKEQYSPPKQLSVACMGDSETAGMIAGGELKASYSWCNKLSMPYPVGNPYKFSSVTNYAVPSKDITQIYNEQLPSILVKPVDVVIIMTGVNDAYHNIPLDVFKQKYFSMLSLLQAKGMTTVCMTTFRTHTPTIDTELYDEYVLTLKGKGCNIVIDVKAYEKPSWTKNINGQIDLHPTEQAYTDVSNVVLNILYML